MADYSKTAGRKIVKVGNESNRGTKTQDQQGTTRIIYDSILLAASTTKQTIRFFENANNRQFPFTNLTENKMQKGENMAMQRFSFSIIQQTASTGLILGQIPFNYFATFGRLYRSDLSFNIGQDQVVKKLPLHSMFAPFNHNSKFHALAGVGSAEDNLFFQFPQDIFWFDNPVIITEDIEFYADLQIQNIALPVIADTNWYICMTLEGLGSLYAPKHTY